MNAAPYRAIDTAAREFRPLPDAKGVLYQTLRKHDNGRLTLLLKFLPDTQYRAHRHPQGEEYFVIEGVLRDMGRDHAAGSYVWHEPGSVHAPSSQIGCVVLVTLPAPIEFIDSAASA